MNPFHFRPSNDDRVDTSKDDATEWHDSPLSNLLAWASWRFVPRWCEQKDHWTTLTADSLFTTCPCCMFYRGIMFGVVAWSLLLATVAILIAIIRAVLA